MTRALALAGALLVTFVAIPAAWPCGGSGGSGGGGGGGGGGGDGGGGGGGGGGDGGGGSVSSTPACVDTTDVHGHRECTRYGTWRAARSAIVVELGMISGMVDLSGIEATGDIDHTDGTSYSYRVVTDDLGGDRAPATGLTLRTLAYGKRWYGGIESNVLFVGADEVQRMEQDSRAMLTPRVTTASSFNGVAGIRTFLPGNVSLAGEVAAGVRWVSVTAKSELGACITESSSLHASAGVEARARADYWVSPWISLGAWGGTDVVSGAPSGGIVLSSHFRSYDGAR